MALRFLPATVREDLMAVYAAARLIDETGDSAQGDRLRLLTALELDLLAAFEDRAQHPVLRGLTPTIRRRDLTRGPFLRLIEANRRDQHDPDLATWDDLVAYCALSANPVGELVLQIFGQADPRRIALSDDICTALQVVEHCQDVAEDHRAGRVYLPHVDREVCGCTRDDLTRTPASEALRRVVALQVERARRLLAAGPALLAALDGTARIAVAGFVAGGLATCRALERADFDPNSRSVRPRRLEIARTFTAALWRSARG